MSLSLEFDSSVTIVKDMNSFAPIQKKTSKSRVPAVEALERRRERNKEMAKRSRAKKKKEIASLEKLYADLCADNEAIKAYLKQFPNEMTGLDDFQLSSSSTDDTVTPSALSMLEHDVDLPEPLVTLALSMLRNEANSASTEAKNSSNGSLDALGLHAMHINPSPTSLNTQEVPMLIVNSTSKEYPIVYASPAFMSLTGYSVGELVGRNCGMFLQSPDSDRVEIDRLHMAITKGHSVSSTLLNCKKDNSAFVNEIKLAHYFDSKHKSCLIVVILKVID